jgi:hypothetical protein
MSGSPILSVEGWLLRQNPALKGGCGKWGYLWVVSPKP